MVVEVLKEAHSILSPSSSERWHNCSGSVQLIAQCPEPEPSKYAEQGTAAHTIAAQILRGENIASGKITTDAGFTFRICETEDSEDTVSLEHIHFYTDWVQALIAEHNLQPNQIRIEHKLKLRGLDANGQERFGTADFMAFIPGYALVVADFKYGAGVGVDPADNLQCEDYLVGAWDGLTDEKKAMIPLVKIVIAQPRGMYRGIKEATRLQVALEMHAQVIDAAIARVFNLPEIKAGSWCVKTFCPAKAHCEAAQKYAEETLGARFDIAVLENKQLPLIAPSEATPDQLAWFCENEDFVINFFNEMRKEAYRRVKSGVPIPRHKIVEKTTHRRWIDDDTVVNAFGPNLGNKIYSEPKLVTPAQMEKVVRLVNECSVATARNAVEAYTVKPEGEHVLALESDKRKEVKANGEAFQAIIDAEVIATNE